MEYLKRRCQCASILILSNNQAALKAVRVRIFRIKTNLVVAAPPQSPCTDILIWVSDRQGCEGIDITDDFAKVGAQSRFIEHETSTSYQKPR